jgi:hypothetical protein
VRNVKCFGWGFAKAKKNGPLPLRHPLNIKAGLKVANEILFAEQGCEFARLYLPNNRLGALYDSARLLFFVVRQKVAQETIFEAFTFTDIDQATAEVEHTVDAG